MKTPDFFALASKYETLFLYTCSQLFVLFFAFQLSGIIDWNWFVVLSPLFANVLLITLIKFKYDHLDVNEIAKEKFEKEQEFQETLEDDLEKYFKQKELEE